MAIIKITDYDIEALSGIESMHDFYEAVGLSEYFKAGSIISIMQIHMDRENCDMLENYIYNTMKKLPKFKGFSDNYVKMSAEMDWFAYSPVSHDHFFKDKIVVLKPGVDWREFFSGY